MIRECNPLACHRTSDVVFVLTGTCFIWLEYGSRQAKSVKYELNCDSFLLLFFLPMLRQHRAVYRMLKCSYRLMSQHNSTTLAGIWPAEFQYIIHTLANLTDLLWCQYPEPVHIAGTFVSFAAVLPLQDATKQCHRPGAGLVPACLTHLLRRVHFPWSG